MLALLRHPHPGGTGTGPLLGEWSLMLSAAALWPAVRIGRADVLPLLQTGQSAF